MVVSRRKAKKYRQQRVRRKVRGTAVRPRLVVSKTLKHIRAQLINDEEGATVASVSTLGKQGMDNLNGAEQIGMLIGDLAKKKGITKVVFDRGGSPYHGKIRRVAEAARKQGLVF